MRTILIMGVQRPFLSQLPKTLEGLRAYRTECKRELVRISYRLNAGGFNLTTKEGQQELDEINLHAQMVQRQIDCIDQKGMLLAGKTVKAKTERVVPGARGEKLD